MTSATNSPKTITTVIPVISDNTITFDPHDITWTPIVGNSDTSTFTHGFIYYDNPDNFRGEDADTKEEPPKTYLNLPTGKRLILL